MVQGRGGGGKLGSFASLVCALVSIADAWVSPLVSGGVQRLPSSAGHFHLHALGGGQAQGPGLLPMESARFGQRRTRRSAGGAGRMGAAGLKGIINEPTPPPEKVLKAVDKLGKRVTAPDLAAAMGIGLGEATKQLSTLASITSGILEVSNDGTIVYSFDKNYRGTLSARSGKRRLAELTESVKPVLFYLLKVSFGVALISSIALIFTAIIAIQSQSSRDDRDDRRGSYRGGGFNMFFGPSYWWGPTPFDFLYYNPYRPYGVNRYRTPGELSFLESVFSFLFGDGDPNSDLEERRYQQIAQLIRENGGAVTAEQLAPYMDPGRPYDRGDAQRLPDEGFILPAITQLQGTPEVTEDGDIVYVFDEMQESAVGAQQPALRGMSVRELKELAASEGISTAGMYDKDDLATGLGAALSVRRKVEARSTPLRPYLEEQEYAFSLASSGQLAAVAALGAVNLFGAVYLGNLLSSPYIAGKTLVGLLGFVQTVYPALVAYAVAFVMVPAIRWFKVKSDNQAIEKRNRSAAPTPDSHAIRIGIQP